MPGSSHARVSAALALACGLHALVLASFYGWNSQSGQQLVPVLVASVEDDIELELEPGPGPGPPQAAAPGAAAASVAEAAAPAQPPSSPPARSPASQRAAADDADQASPEGEPAPSQPDAAAAPASPPDRVVDLGLGPEAWQQWARLGQGEAPPAKPRTRKRTSSRVVQAPKASTTGGLLEGLEAHDRELGLGPSGPVIGALYRAAHGAEAPQTGAARFEVTVLKSGSVQVALLGASDRAAAWAKVGALAAEAIRKAPPRIAEPRSGTRMVIAVTAEEVFPNGTRREQLYAPRLEGVAPKLRSTREGEAKLKELNPVAGDTGAPVTGQSVIVDVPGVYVAGRGAVCSYRIGISVLGPMLSGGCDLSNAGAKAQRRVSTQVEEQAMF